MSAAVEEGVGTTLEDAAWWEMDVPCRNYVPCSKTATWLLIHPCGCHLPLCDEHAANDRKANDARVALAGDECTATCKHCGTSFRCADVKVLPL